MNRAYCTVLLLCYRNGNIYIMYKMMQQGADLRVADEQGKTALHHAVSGGSM